MSDDESQVIILIKDLGLLPKKEQLYWKSYNEKRSSNLSKQMILNVYKGEWIELDVLDSLKYLLKNFPKCYIDNIELNFWEEPKTKSPHTLNDLNYVKINSKEDWELEINTLYLNIIDGLSNKTINLISKKLNCYDKDLKSIKQLQEYLIKQKIIPNSEIEEIIEPLERLNFYRSKVISHNTNNEYPNENLNENFRNLLNDCFTSMKFISNMIKSELFNF